MAINLKIATDGSVQFLKKEPCTLLYFWSPWCGICLEYNELLEFEKAYAKVIVKAVNMEENPLLVDSYNVLLSPTYVFLKNGQCIRKLVGKQNIEQLSKNVIDL